jgi:hypothetical protein
MDMMKEQYVCVKFCREFGKMVAETYKILQQLFRETVFSQFKMFAWDLHFNNG